VYLLYFIKSVIGFYTRFERTRLYKTVSSSRYGSFKNSFPVTIWSTKKIKKIPSLCEGIFVSGKGYDFYD
jgi:hypothetical protein